MERTPRPNSKEGRDLYVDYVCPTMRTEIKRACADDRPSRFDYRVLLAVHAMLGAWSRLWDNMAVAQITQYVYGLEERAPVEGWQRKHVSESLRRLHKWELIDYQAGIGRTSTARVAYKTVPEIQTPSGNETHPETRTPSPAKGHRNSVRKGTGTQSETAPPGTVTPRVSRAPTGRAENPSAKRVRTRAPETPRLRAALVRASYAWTDPELRRGRQIQLEAGSEFGDRLIDPADLADSMAWAITTIVGKDTADDIAHQLDRTVDDEPEPDIEALGRVWLPPDILDSTIDNIPITFRLPQHQSDLLSAAGYDPISWRIAQHMDAQPLDQEKATIAAEDSRTLWRIFDNDLDQIDNVVTRWENHDDIEIVQFAEAWARNNHIGTAGAA